MCVWVSVYIWWLVDGEWCVVRCEGWGGREKVTYVTGLPFWLLVFTYLSCLCAVKSSCQLRAPRQSSEFARKKSETGDLFSPAFRQKDNSLDLNRHKWQDRHGLWPGTEIAIEHSVQFGHTESASESKKAHFASLLMHFIAHLQKLLHSLTHIHSLTSRLNRFHRVGC